MQTLVRTAPVRPPYRPRQITERLQRLLVVGDDGETTRTLVNLLYDHDGYDVEWVPSPLEALALAADRRFDLILLDTQPSAGESLATCRSLRAAGPNGLTPILMLSQGNSLADAEAAFGHGMTDYMGKPYSLSQVRARIRSWVARGQHLGLQPPRLDTQN